MAKPAKVGGAKLKGLKQHCQASQLHHKNFRLFEGATEMKCTRIAITIGVLMGASLPSHAQLASLVMGGLQALPKVMTNAYDKLTADSSKCEQELAESRAKMESIKSEHPGASSQLGAFEGMIQAKYQACKQRAEKAQNGSIIDGEVVATAVGGAIGYQAMIGTATAAGSISAATGSNAVALQSMGLDPRMSSSGAMAASITNTGGIPHQMAMALPGLGMPGVMPGLPTAMPSTPGVVTIPGITTGMGGTADVVASTIFGRVLGSIFNDSARTAFIADSLLKIDDVVLATGSREQVRSSLAAKGLMPQAPQPGYEGFGDSYSLDGSKILLAGASSLSLGYVSDGHIAMSVFDVSKFPKDQLEAISKTITEQYGKPTVHQEGTLARASWAVEGGSLFLAKEGSKTSLGWRSEERLAQLVTEIQSRMKPMVAVK